MFSGLDIESILLCENHHMHKNLGVLCSDKLPLLQGYWQRLTRNTKKKDSSCNIKDITTLMRIKQVVFFDHDNAQDSIMPLPKKKDITANYKFYRFFDHIIINHRIGNISLNNMIDISLIGHEICQENGYIIHQIQLHSKLNNHEIFDFFRHLAVSNGYIWRFAVCNGQGGQQRNLDLMNNFAHVFSDFKQQDFNHLIEEFRNSQHELRRADLYILVGFEKLKHKSFQWQNFDQHRHYVRSPRSDALSLYDNMPPPQDIQEFPSQHPFHNFQQYLYYPFAHYIFEKAIDKIAAYEILQKDFNTRKQLATNIIKAFLTADIVKKLLQHSANSFISYYGEDIFKNNKNTIDDFCYQLFFRINMDDDVQKISNHIYGNRHDELLTLLFYFTDGDPAKFYHFSPLGNAVAYDNSGILNDSCLIRPAKIQPLYHNQLHLHIATWNSFWRIHPASNSQKTALLRVDIAHKDVCNIGKFTKSYR